METLENPEIPALSSRHSLKDVWEYLKLHQALCAGVLGALFVGFVLGRCSKGTSSAGRGETLDLSKGNWVRSSSSSFEIFLPRGWESLSAEANIGMAGENRREAVLREKDPSGFRLLMLQRLNPKKANAGKLENFLGSWIMSQKQEIQQLRQETASSFPASQAADAAGTPVEIVRLINPPASARGPAISVGVLAFKGRLYDFSFVTSHPKDSELLLGLLGSLRQGEKPAEAKKAAPPAKKASAPNKAKTRVK